MTDPLHGTAYRAIARLGRGGMGEVWEAEHLELGKKVVVKVLHARLAEDRGHLDRFRAEARVLARLAHPNVVAVSDFGWVQGRPFFVMEHVQARTLADEVRLRGALPFGEVTDLAQQLLAGLAAAHAVGVVHRDVKPANVLYAAPSAGLRRVVLVDFGLVKQLTPIAPLSAPTLDGATLGTPGYLAPEQALGRKVDARTDLYAVGAVLYRLITGRGPFEHHATLRAVMEAHLYEPPVPPSHHVPGLPAVLDAVLLRAMSKRPENRFESADAMALALRRVVPSASRVGRHADAPVVTRPVPSTPRGTPPALLPTCQKVVIDPPAPSALQVAAGSDEAVTRPVVLPLPPEAFAPGKAAPSELRSSPASALRDEREPSRPSRTPTVRISPSTSDPAKLTVAAGADVKPHAPHARHALGGGSALDAAWFPWIGAVLISLLVLASALAMDLAGRSP